MSHQQDNTKQEDLDFDESLLSAYLDGELSQESVQQVDLAIASDPSLRKTLDDLRSVRKWIQSIPSITPHASAFQGEWNQRTRPTIVSESWSWAIMGTVAAGIISVATGIYFLPLADKDFAPAVAMKSAAKTERQPPETELALKEAKTNASSGLSSATENAALPPIPFSQDFTGGSVPEMASRPLESAAPQLAAPQLAAPQRAAPSVDSRVKRMMGPANVPQMPSATMPTVQIRVRRTTAFGNASLSPPAKSTAESSVNEVEPTSKLESSTLNEPASGDFLPRTAIKESNKNKLDSSKSLSPAPSGGPPTQTRDMARMENFGLALGEANNATDQTYFAMPRGELNDQDKKANAEMSRIKESTETESSFRIDEAMVIDGKVEIVIPRAQLERILQANGLIQVRPDPEFDTALKSTPPVNVLLSPAENDSKDEWIKLVLEIIP